MWGWTVRTGPEAVKAFLTAAITTGAVVVATPGAGSIIAPDPI
jgi:hypothetical protein